jgi:hypothetical protein
MLTPAFGIALHSPAGVVILLFMELVGARNLIRLPPMSSAAFWPAPFALTRAYVLSRLARN